MSSYTNNVFTPSKAECLTNKGLSSPDLAKVLYAKPSILHRSLHKQIIPSFKFFKGLLKENVEKLKGMRFDPKEMKFGLGVFIMAIMDYFVRKMGCKALFVAECPSLTTFSLEKKRIVPRGSVAQGLLSKVLIKNDLGLSTLFHTSEKLFLKRFVNHYKEEASQLLKLYDEKLMLVKYAL
ncbi:uncharacterized protein LOC112095625 [Citrus clementina]|uniref:uncharacterized protein LOC112095625 n=1 Tax=Citrus clementina TaxID=85681 RepID=UPI000CED06C2|nr:uncharacterized protein LOC112095625 [Citrus x clementina]